MRLIGPVLALYLVLVPLAVEAQVASKVHRVAYLGNSSAALDSDLVVAFRQGLRELNQVEGQNLIIDFRSAESRYERFTIPQSVLARADHVIEQSVLDQRGQLLMAALGFAGCAMPSYDRALWALRTWLDSWAGIGHVVLGMARQGYDLQLTRYDEKGWRAAFDTTGMEHSPTSTTGTGWERTPWHAVQRAAWETLRQVSAVGQGGRA